MLLALLPDQIAEQWDNIKAEVSNAMPPHADYGPYDMNNIFASLMMGGMQAWIVKDEDRVVGLVITTNLTDVSGVSTLLLYSVVVLAPSKQALWKEALDTLMDFGRGKGCAKIASFVANDRLISLCREAGAETRFVFVNYNL